MLLVRELQKTVRNLLSQCSYKSRMFSSDCNFTALVRYPECTREVVETERYQTRYIYDLYDTSDNEIE